MKFVNLIVFVLSLTLSVLLLYTEGKGVTVIKDLTRKVCFITKINPSLPSPRKLKSNIRRATAQPGSPPVVTEPNLLTVMGPAHRPSLSKEVLAFCGDLPIYEADASQLHTNASSGSEIIHQRLHGRQKRTVALRSFTTCSSQDMGNLMKCMDQSILQCRFKDGSCYYFVSCKASGLQRQWECKNRHMANGNPVCCSVKCP